MSLYQARKKRPTAGFKDGFEAIREPLLALQAFLARVYNFQKTAVQLKKAVWSARGVGVVRQACMVWCVWCM